MIEMWQCETVCVWWFWFRMVWGRSWSQTMIFLHTVSLCWSENVSFKTATTMVARLRRVWPQWRRLRRAIWNAQSCSLTRRLMWTRSTMLPYDLWKSLHSVLGVFCKSRSFSQLAATDLIFFRSTTNHDCRTVYVSAIGMLCVIVFFLKPHAFWFRSWEHHAISENRTNFISP